MKLKLNCLCLALLATTGTVNAYVLTDVGPANPKTPGMAAANLLSKEWAIVQQATGAMKLDCADDGSVSTFVNQYYGYIPNTATGGNTMLPILGATGGVFPSLPIPVMSKTEPDKNTYLNFPIGTVQHGCAEGYNYGNKFVFQGHEAGEHGYITRVNLEADGAHRVTLLANTLSDGVSLIPNLDGSTFNPFTGKLMFTGEENQASGVAEGVVLESEADRHTDGSQADVTKLDGIFGHAGWEGIQVDGDGNIWLVEDVGGSKGTGANSSARRPNSYVYRFVPVDKTNLQLGGQLQVLQVQNAFSRSNIYHADQTADQSITGTDIANLHKCGVTYDTLFFTIHDTDVDGFAPFNANDLAKAQNVGTPFKRPENGVFRPGKSFKEFYFTETGDTDINGASSDLGGFGAVFKLSFDESPSDFEGHFSVLYKGDVAHAGFDNITFLTTNDLLVVEDAGDSLHTQRNALDSGYKFDLAPASKPAQYCSASSSVPAKQPIRFLAEGRDASATLDSGAGSGDNEITGIHVSNGSTTVPLGGEPLPFVPSPLYGVRVFFTQQHGDNTLWEIIRSPR